MVIKVEKSVLLGKPSICFILKKKILNISLSILSIQSPKEKEVRKLTAYLVNGRLRDLFSMHPGGSSYSPTQLENAPRLVWAHQDPPMSAPPPTSPQHHQHLTAPIPDCFTSCCQEFNTLRLTSTPCFHVLCCFFQVYSHHTAAENGYKSGQWLRALQGVGKVPTPCHRTMWSQIQVNLY